MMYVLEQAGAMAAQLQISEGAIFPLTKRIKDEGYVATYLREAKKGPPRKQFSIADRGRTTLQAVEAEWRNLSKGTNIILEG